MKHFNFTYDEMISFADHVKETDPVRLTWDETTGKIKEKAILSTEDLLKEWYNRKLVKHNSKSE